MRRLVRLLSYVAGVLTAFLALATAALLSAATSSSQSSAEGPVVTAEPKKQSQTGPVVLGVVALVVAAVAAAPALVRFRRRTGERA